MSLLIQPSTSLSEVLKCLKQRQTVFEILTEADFFRLQQSDGGSRESESASLSTDRSAFGERERKGGGGEGKGKEGGARIKRLKNG